MRINDINQASASVNSKIIGEDQKSGTDTFRVFSRELTNLSRDHHQKYITSLIDEITIQGDKVAQKADISELQKYRELIIKLVKENASNSFSFEKRDLFDARGRHKVFSKIKTVNKHLDELTSEILKDQSENIKIVDLVDSIKGILVDIFL